MRRLINVTAWGTNARKQKNEPTLLKVKRVFLQPGIIGEGNSTVSGTSETQNPHKSKD